MATQAISVKHQPQSAELASGAKTPINISSKPKLVEIIDIDLASQYLHFYWMDENNLELNESIQKIGIQEPLLVRRIHHSRREGHGPTYELIDGRARMGAAINFRSLSDKVPVLVVNMSDEQVRSLQWRKISWSVIGHVFNLKPTHPDEHPPFGLRQLAGHIGWRKKGALSDSYIKAQYLDEIARGMKSKRHMTRAYYAHYSTDHSLSDIQWWQDTLNILYSDNKHQIPDSIAQDMKTLMAAYAETYLVNHKLRSDKTDQAFEFLRLYAVFRKGIINLAERLWPQVDMQPLRDQV